MKQNNSTELLSHTFIKILWATPSASGPRPLLIALGLQILGIAASGSCLFWYTNLLFRMIGSFTLVPWGTLGLFWDTREHSKGLFGGQAWISIDFWCHLACLEPLLWRPGAP